MPLPIRSGAILTRSGSFVKVVAQRRRNSFRLVPLSRLDRAIGANLPPVPRANQLVAALGEERELFSLLTQAVYHLVALNRLSRRELLTTDTEEVAMATPAKIGFSRIPKKGYHTPAASGIRATL